MRAMERGIRQLETDLADALEKRRQCEHIEFAAQQGLRHLSYMVSTFPDAVAVHRHVLSHIFQVRYKEPELTVAPKTALSDDK